MFCFGRPCTVQNAGPVWETDNLANERPNFTRLHLFLPVIDGRHSNVSKSVILISSRIS